MAFKEHHRIERRAGSLEGCWILAGDNVPGYHALITSRPGGAPEEHKVIQGIIPKFTVNLGSASPCAHWNQIQNQKSKIKNYCKTLVINEAQSKSHLLKPSKGGRGVPLKINLCRPAIRRNGKRNNQPFNNLRNLQPSTFNLQHREKNAISRAIYIVKKVRAPNCSRAHTLNLDSLRQFYDSR